MPNVLVDVVESYLFGSFLLDCTKDQLPATGSMIWQIGKNAIQISDGKDLMLTFLCPERVHNHNKAKLITGEPMLHGRRGIQEEFPMIRMGYGRPPAMRTPNYRCYSSSNAVVVTRYRDFPREVCVIYNSEILRRNVLHYSKAIVGATAFGRTIISLDLDGVLWYSTEIDDGSREVPAPLVDGVEDCQAEMMVEEDILWIQQATRVWYRSIGVLRQHELTKMD